MPDETLFYEILKQLQVEFAACDASRKVYKHSWGLVELTNNDVTSINGQLVENLFDELTGSEATLELVRTGQLPNLKFEKATHTFANGQEGYLTLTVTPFAGGLLLLVADVTTEGLLEQRITQQRNELHLLAHELANTQVRLDDLLRRFVPGTVADEMIANPEAVRLGGQQRDVTILYADLQGFTGWVKQQGSLEEGFTLLNSKLAVAAKAIIDEEGTLDRYLGDAVMAIFNAPRQDDQHVWHAVRAAWHFTQMLRNDPTPQFGVGIHSGTAVVGNIGIPQAMNYTAIGDAVDQAKRLQKMAQPGQILISVDCLSLLPENIRTQPLAGQPDHGKDGATEIFEVIDL